MEKLKLPSGLSRTPDGILIRIYRRGQTQSAHIAWSAHPDEGSTIQAAIAKREQMMREWPRKVAPARKPTVKYVQSGFVAGRQAHWRVDYWPQGVHKAKRFNMTDWPNAEREARKFAEEHK